MNHQTTPRARRHLSIESHNVLPFFDGIFAVAFTLIAYSVPEELKPGNEGMRDLMLAIVGFLLSGLTVLLYWVKLRRLIQMARRLQRIQLVLGFLSLLTVVALPKMCALAIHYSGGQGNLRHWSDTQTANTLFLGALFLVNLLVLLFAFSLVRHGPRPASAQRTLHAMIRSQSAGFIVFLGLGILELAATWFNAQYVVMIPLVLLVEEAVLAWRLTGIPATRPAASPPQP